MLNGLRLLLLDPTSQPTKSTFVLPIEGTARIGREHASGVRIDDRRVTRKHALLTTGIDGVWFENMSAFGARVNGQPVDGRKPHRLFPGDIIEFAEGLRLQLVEEPRSSSPTQ